PTDASVCSIYETGLTRSECESLESIRMYQPGIVVDSPEVCTRAEMVLCDDERFVGCAAVNRVVVIVRRSYCDQSHREKDRPESCKCGSDQRGTLTPFHEAGQSERDKWEQWCVVALGE